jgi:cyanate permease
MLALVTLAHMLVVGVPWTVMPVLFTAAADELHLSISQIGLLWSMLPIGAAAIAVPGGMLGDRLGFVRTIGIGCFAIAAANALRGLATGLPTLTLSMFLCGAAIALVFPNLQRVSGIFFPRRQLGLATGISVSGFAIGGVLTTALSATVVMPLTGSWRHVLFLYSLICLAVGAVWLLVLRGRGTPPPETPGMEPSRPGPASSVSAVFGSGQAWLLAIGELGLVGSFISLNGYLPVYLESTGLAKSLADTMTSTLFVASIAGAIGIPALADRIGAGKTVMIVCATITAAAIALLAASVDPLYWALIPLVGATTQGIGTLALAHAMQIRKIGRTHAGTALGFIGGMANFGGFVMPAIGGKLAEANQTWPFFLWALLSLAGAVCFAFLRNPRSS